MSKELDDGIKRNPAEKNPWYEFMKFTIDLDKEFEESFGIHWFVGIYLLHKELNGFKRLELQQIKDALPDGHEFRKIDILEIPFTPNKKTSLEEIHANLLQKDVFIILNKMLNKYGISKKISGHEVNEIDFSGLIFEDNINFSELVFPIDVSFVGTKFATTANFANTIFCDRANFDQAVFSNGANFYRAKFSGETHLSRINFYQNMYQTSFTEATFSGLTIIRETKFYGNTYFEKTVFSNWAIFIDTQFLHPVEFRTATFFSNADFTNTIFATWAIFENTTFSGKMTFKNATFSESISFDNIKVTGRTDFTNAKFKKSAPSFHNANLHPDVLWDMVEWSDDAKYKFSWAKIKKEIFSWTGIRNLVANRSATKKLIYDWLDIKRQTDKKTIRDNQNAYETLAYHMEGLDKYHDQHLFFRKETRCRRWLEKKPFMYCLYWLYEKFVNYGYGVEPAFRAWRWHMFIGAVIIFIGAVVNAWLESWKYGFWGTVESMFCSIPVSVANSHGFLFFNNGPFKGCYEYFEGNLFFNTIWAFQTILGVIFLFLLLLTLRVRFRLK